MRACYQTIGFLRPCHALISGESTLVSRRWKLIFSEVPLNAAGCKLRVFVLWESKGTPRQKLAAEGCGISASWNKRAGSRATNADPASHSEALEELHYAEIILRAARARLNSPDGLTSRLIHVACRGLPQFRWTGPRCVPSCPTCSKRAIRLEKRVSNSACP